MSGGPAFIYRDLYAEWVGIVYQFSSDFDLMYIRPSHLLGSDSPPQREPVGECGAELG